MGVGECMHCAVCIIGVRDSKKNVYMHGYFFSCMNVFMYTEQLTLPSMGRQVIFARYTSLAQPRFMLLRCG